MMVAGKMVKDVVKVPMHQRMVLHMRVTFLMENSMVMVSIFQQQDRVMKDITKPIRDQDKGNIIHTQVIHTLVTLKMGNTMVKVNLYLRMEYQSMMEICTMASFTALGSGVVRVKSTMANGEMTNVLAKVMITNTQQKY